MIKGGQIKLTERETAPTTISMRNQDIANGVGAEGDWLPPKAKELTQKTGPDVVDEEAKPTQGRLEQAEFRLDIS